MKLKTIEASRLRTQAAQEGAAKTPATGSSPAAESIQASESPMQASEDAARAAGERACPTRADGAMPLFQHRVTVAQCQSKQRGMYHKCFSCAHSNAQR